MVDILPIAEVKFNHPDIKTPLSPPPDELQHYINYAESDDEYSIPSFESLLSGLSKAPYSRVSFMSYLKARHCSENLEFLMNSNQYILTSKRLEANSSSMNYEFIQNERHQLWHHIYNQFISHDSPKEVNIPSDLKTELNRYSNSSSLPQVELVENTMISVKELLRDTYFQFISSVKRASPQYQEEQPHFFSSKTPLMKKYNGELNDNYSLNPIISNNSCDLNEQSPLDTHSFNNSRAQSPLSCESVSFETRSPVQEYQNRSNKSSFSEAGVGLKKFAGRLKWRRLSSNSSASSN